MMSDDEAQAGEQLTAPDADAATPADQAGETEERAAAPDERAAAPDERAESADAGAGATDVMDEEPVSGPVRARGGGVRGLPGRAARGAGRIRPRWRIASLAVLVVLVAGAGFWDASLASQRSQAQDTLNAENAAMAAATTDVGQILSYDYQHLSADLAQASRDTTGEFNSQFAVLATELISPAAAQQHTITKATVPDVSVVSATGNQVVVLAFVDQSTTDKSQPKAQKNVSQVKVTMQNIGGRWLVEQFQAL
jgi:Mce-associated membrane protein